MVSRDCEERKRLSETLYLTFASLYWCLPSVLLFKSSGALRGVRKGEHLSFYHPDPFFHIPLFNIATYLISALEGLAIGRIGQ